MNATTAQKMSSISMDCVNIPERKDTDGFKDSIHWAIKLTAGSYTTETEYSEGIGHFVNTRHHLYNKIIMENPLADFKAGKPLKIHVSAPGGISQKEWESFWIKDRFNFAKGKATPPKLEDILYALTMDSDAINYSFDEWCSNYGYDTDSRKALATWHKCTDTYRKLRALGFTLEELQEYFRDY